MIVAILLFMGITYSLFGVTNVVTGISNQSALDVVAASVLLFVGVVFLTVSIGAYCEFLGDRDNSTEGNSCEK